jgi:hypothetical protein
MMFDTISVSWVVDQVDQVDQFDQFDQVDQVDQVDQFDQFDQFGLVAVCYTYNICVVSRNCQLNT